MADCTEFESLVTRVAMNIASGTNMKSIDDVIMEMQTHFPQFSRDGIIDAIANATTKSPREVADLTKKLRKIKQEARTEKSLKQKISELEDLLEKGELPETMARVSQATETINKLREVRNELAKALRGSEPAQLERIGKQISALEEKLKTGDVMPKAKKETAVQSKELERAIYERDLLRQEIRNQIYSLKPKTPIQRIAEGWDIVRLALTTGEFSFVLRQGAPFVLGHPVKGVNFVAKALKAFANDQYAAKINHQILSRDLAPVAMRAKLHLIPVDGTVALSKQEEIFMSQWAERLPVIRNFTRAGITFMNLVRAESFDSLYRTVGKTDSLTQDEANIIANYANTATGRGNLSKLEPNAVLLNRIFFAPKYVVSRFQYLLGQPLWTRAGKGSLEVRKAIAKEYIRTLLGLSVMYALGMAAGGELEKDPRSSDFMKLRFGKSRIDPLFGLSQSTVILARLITGEYKKTTTGEIVPIRGEDVPFAGMKVDDVIKNFGRYKLSPLIGVPWSVIAKEDPIGNKIDAKWAAAHLMTPITWADAYEAIKEHGVGEGLALSTLAFWGIGLQTYQDRRTTKRRKSVKL